MEMMLLKTGKTVPKPLAMTTMISLEQLICENPMVFFELVELCRDSGHRLWGGEDELKALSLLQENGRVQSDVREIVLSATDGEGLNLTLTSPFVD